MLQSTWKLRRWAAKLIDMVLASAGLTLIAIGVFCDFVAALISIVTTWLAVQERDMLIATLFSALQST